MKAKRAQLEAGVRLELPAVWAQLVYAPISALFSPSTREWHYDDQGQREVVETYRAELEVDKFTGWVQARFWLEELDGE